MPHKVREGIKIGPRRVSAPRLGYRKETPPPKIICNNPRSSIKPESAPDPKNEYTNKHSDIFGVHNEEMSKIRI